MGIHNIQHKLERADFTSDSVGLFKTPEGRLFGYGTTVPSDGVTGWAPGARFTHTDGSGNADLSFVNVGSMASCDFDSDLLPQGSATIVLTSQTTENVALGLSLTTDSTYLTGSNLTWSGARGSSILKLTGVYSGVTGGFSALYFNVTTSGAIGTDGNGVIGLKGVVTNSAALTDGEVYGAQFIAKHAATGTMLAGATLCGLEAWAYISSSGPARTVLGANLGIHNECSGAYGAGSVLRGVQIFCDNAAAAEVPVESTGLCIWNQAGAWDNAINIVNSGNGYTNFVKFTDDGSPAQSSSSAVNNVGTKGWIKVLIGSATRYIALGDGVS